MKILIAEDDPVSRMLMQRTLEKSGYEIVLAEDGRIAAEILSQADGPRLALVDWMMPELDGLGVCREVRTSQRNGSYVYIVLLTARQNRADIIAGLEAGADDYITKPYHPAELRARLRTGQRILSLEERLIQAREEMRYKATHDTLTTLWNRSSIFYLAQTEILRAARDRRKVSFLLCDIDHFKRVNDNHGHLIGDLVLKEVAQRLFASVRAYDAVGRYGGEEFLVVLTDCNHNCARQRAEDIRGAIGSTPIQAGDLDLSISISIGGMTVDEATAPNSFEVILAQVDAALYRAKAEGRDRVAYVSTLNSA
jgi:two-component system cell cycle response regulator